MPLRLRHPAIVLAFCSIISDGLNVPASQNMGLHLNNQFNLCHDGMFNRSVFGEKHKLNIRCKSLIVGKSRAVKHEIDPADGAGVGATQPLPDALLVVTVPAGQGYAGVVLYKLGDADRAVAGLLGLEGPGGEQSFQPFAADVAEEEVVAGVDSEDREEDDGEHHHDVDLDVEVDRAKHKGVEEVAEPSALLDLSAQVEEHAENLQADEHRELQDGDQLDGASQLVGLELQLQQEEDLGRAAGLLVGHIEVEGGEDQTVEVLVVGRREAPLLQLLLRYHEGVVELDAQLYHGLVVRGLLDKHFEVGGGQHSLDHRHPEPGLQPRSGPSENVKKHCQHRPGHCVEQVYVVQLAETLDYLRVNLVDHQVPRLLQQLVQEVLVHCQLMNITVSLPGLDRLARSRDRSQPQRGLLWTTDPSQELPVLMAREGLGAVPASTLPREFEAVVREQPDSPALSKKVAGSWATLSYKQYFEQSQRFGQALLKWKVGRFKSVNINGFNAPEWSIAFMGAVFARSLPVGVYNTNGPQACLYVADHSECECLVLEGNSMLNKYLPIIGRIAGLKVVIVYNETKLMPLAPELASKVLLWSDFLASGLDQQLRGQIRLLMGQQQPGNCCTVVYTSGTTGNPKGVLLSHDNYLYNVKVSLSRSNDIFQRVLVSYLPLSHVAGQISDVVGAMVGRAHVYFADPSALQGSLIDYLREVRPTVFFSVPRVWQKIYERLTTIGKNNNFLLRRVAEWAKSIGVQGTIAERKGLPVPFGWQIAKRLVFQNVKKQLGLDRVKKFLYGAAPLSPAIREYFLQLNILLVNSYGMSQCAGPQCMTDLNKFDNVNIEYLAEAGTPFEGTELKIVNLDIAGDGQICFRGRNRFMGYLKDIDSTVRTIDKQGFVHSGDVGRLDSKGNLFITGRLKQLIITSGGQNVAPVLIEQAVKQQLPFLSNCVVIGDKRRFLSCLLTLRSAGDQLDKDTVLALSGLGIQQTQLSKLRQSSGFQKLVERGVKAANEKAISKAQFIVKHAILEEDLSVENGCLTPTMKLKRSEIEKRFRQVIEGMYETRGTL